MIWFIAFIDLLLRCLSINSSISISICFYICRCITIIYAELYSHAASDESPIISSMMKCIQWSIQSHRLWLRHKHFSQHHKYRKNRVIILTCILKAKKINKPECEPISAPFSTICVNSRFLNANKQNDSGYKVIRWLFTHHLSSHQFIQFKFKQIEN